MILFNLIPQKVQPVNFCIFNIDDSQDCVEQWLGCQTKIGTNSHSPMKLATLPWGLLYTLNITHPSGFL